MLYQLHESPFLGLLDFTKMSKQDARDYFDWYMGQIPRRRRIFEIAVQSSGDKFATWQADCSAESLTLLGDWYSGVVAQEPTTKAYQERYLQNARASLPEHLWSIIEVPYVKITPATWSLIIDLGMYFGETLRNYRANIEWKAWLTGSKKYVDYQRTILVDTETRRHCNPQRLMHVVALKYCKRKPSTRLNDLFTLRLNALSGQD